ncbi:MAG: hypothetical protein NT023_01410 [Armatimonadetes bacterium]|nr:hypothetical protein [Armatimonadota bacterium]
MMKLLLLLFALPTLLAALPVTERVEKVRPALIREAVNRSLPLLQSSLKEYPSHAACFSCHHQGVGMFTLALARSKGYLVAAKSLEATVQHTLADLRTDLELYKNRKGQPGGVTRAGYALLALQSGGTPKDAVTEAVSAYILQRDKAQDFWNSSSNRPPSEASVFTDTFLAIRALKVYGEEAQKEEIVKRIERTRQWLEQAKLKDTEDRVFQLWALHEAGATKEVLHKSASDLLKEQKEDGGWAQLPASNSDPYATGSVLTVLALTGETSVDEAAFQRGIRFLLKTQQVDGSWHVVSRSKPFQPYFESGFPHGKDQFISAAASGWATSALVLASSPSQKRPQ